MTKLKYFSAFTGIGGLDQGLEEMGAECVGFSEIKESSVGMYLSHYPDHKNYGDITEIKPEDLPDFDIYTSGFPCQSFSMVGARKGFDDRRGKMIFYIYDILKCKKPKYVVLENVKGILSHDDGKTVRNVVALLQLAGYHVRILLLNSCQLGSAQARERAIFIGRRDGDFPKEYPVKTDDSKRFRDVRDDIGPFRFPSARAMARIGRDPDAFLFIGGYDRVNTLTTGISTSGRKAVLCEHSDGRLRYLTEREGERLQGMPDDWTLATGSDQKRWFAIGNAVNMKMSSYLFGSYLKKLWSL